MASADTDWDLIDGIYDAVLERGTWGTVLERLAAKVGDRPAQLQRQNFVSKSVDFIHTANLDPRYRDGFLTPRYGDPARNGWRWQRLYGRPGRFLRWTTVFPEERLYREEPIFEDVYKPAGVSFDWAFPLDGNADSSSVFGFVRRLDDAPMLDEDVERIMPYVPHIARAMAQMARFDILDARLTSLESAVDSAGVATIVIGSDGTVQFVNDAAARLLRHGDGLTVQRNRLHAVDHAMNARLTRLIDGAGRTGQSQGDGAAGSALTVPRTPPLAPLTVDVMPVATGRHTLTGPRPAAVVTVTVPDAGPKDMIGRLTRSYQLSPMQARVAAALIDGKSQTVVADELSITRNTLKTHVRRLYDKLDCTSRADLIRLAAGLAGGNR
jgi:DNA-binding CsgD family transcriptional regulator/PAS domain-containing protein